MPGVLLNLNYALKLKKNVGMVQASVSKFVSLTQEFYCKLFKNYLNLDLSKHLRSKSLFKVLFFEFTPCINTDFSKKRV